MFLITAALLGCGLGLLSLALRLRLLKFMSVFAAHSYPAAILPQQKGAEVRMEN